MGEREDDVANYALPEASRPMQSGPDHEARKFDSAAEVEALLEADQTVLGEVWRESRAGKTPAVLAEQWKITTGPIYSSLATARNGLSGHNRR